MSTMSSHQSILADLSKSIEQESPADVLQYCADWFQDRLREQRSGTTASTPSSAPQPTVRQAPPAMNFPFVAGGFNHHLSQPSPFSEHGPADSPFGPSNGSLFQRRATTAYSGGAPLFPSSGGTVPAAATTGGLPQLAEEGEDGSTPAATAPGGAGLFGAFTFDSQADPSNIVRESSPSRPPPSPSRFPPQASSSGTAQATADELVVPSYALGRRTSVSAESLVPTAQGGRTNGAPGESDATAVLREPKTESQLARIKQSIAPNFLFRNLDEEQERDVLAAMKEVSVKKGEVIIEQGAAGDYFYVVDSGSFDIFVNKPGEPVGDDARELEKKWGKKVGTWKSGMSFGELALMYNAPRAATVIANENSTVWALDRISFRTILLDHTSRKRRMYEAFLSTVPILTSLEGYERAKIADALESRTYKPGEIVISEGEPGEEFFLIESGTAECSKKDVGVVNEYGKGDYFGELALINREPRAATVRASNKDGNVLRVAALGEKAFTRLLGPVKDIMARATTERYGGASGKPFGH